MSNPYQINVESMSNPYRIDVEFSSNRRRINRHLIDIESLSIQRRNPHSNPRRYQSTSNRHRILVESMILTRSNPRRILIESTSVRCQFDVESIDIESTSNRHRIDIESTSLKLIEIL